MKPRIDTVSVPVTITGTEITIPFRAICSVTKKVFRGFIVVDYRPRTAFLEFVSIERYVHHVAKRPLTAEELCAQVYDAVHASIRPRALCVTVDIRHSLAHQPARIWRASPTYRRS